MSAALPYPMVWCMSRPRSVGVAAWPEARESPQAREPGQLSHAGAGTGRHVERIAKEWRHPSTLRLGMWRAWECASGGDVVFLDGRRHEGPIGGSLTWLWSCPPGARHVEGQPLAWSRRVEEHRHQPTTAGRLGPRPYAGGDAAGVRRVVSARVAKMSSMSCIPWGVMPIVC
jgi:hypothetical protein